MNLLPDEYKHLKGSVIGDMMKAAILRSIVVTTCKAILGLAVIAACLKYVF